MSKMGSRLALRWLTGFAGIHPPRVGRYTLNFCRADPTGLVGTAENKEARFTVADAFFLERFVLSIR
jgi:hypothetical protein